MLSLLVHSSLFGYGIAAFSTRLRNRDAFGASICVFWMVVLLVSTWWWS
jgi:hypothetical protein